MIQMQHLPLELIDYIFTYSKFISQIRLVQSSNIPLNIIDFYSIDDKYKKNLTDNILSNYKCIKYLYVCRNSKITTVNHCLQLQKLNASYDCGISNFAKAALSFSFNPSE